MLHLAMSPTRLESPLSRPTDDLLSPTDEFLSPLGTPPTERVQKIVEGGLAAAEALDAEGMTSVATEIKAAVLVEAAQEYAKLNKKRMAREQRKTKGRSPLRKVTNHRELAASGAQQATAQVAEEAKEEVSTVGFPTPPRTPIVSQGVFAAAAAPQSITAPPTAASVSTSPRDVQAIIIAKTSLIRPFEGSAFTEYQLRIPLLSGECVAYHRFRDFVAFDFALREALGDRSLLPGADCLWLRELPPLPPRTIPLLQSATAPAVVAQRWLMLQRYLDAVLERVSDNPDAFEVLKSFLGVP